MKYEANNIIAEATPPIKKYNNDALDALYDLLCKPVNKYKE
ncbi:hypothetical protein QG37_04180 [Candidozyma auris]|uniref:Uncharacterized protein n=1 Tax=Candidozyma auris TaxID=498019 RepID=A0A0L0NXM9_CANAR|nr:hypothetical protein QG37_04180 [[Candida] auris]